MINFDSILYLVGSLLGLFYVYSLLKLLWYEYRINGEYKDMKDEIDMEKLHKDNDLNKKIEEIKARYSPIIEEFESLSGLRHRTIF